MHPPPVLTSKRTHAHSTARPCPPRLRHHEHGLLASVDGAILAFAFSFRLQFHCGLSTHLCDLSPFTFIETHCTLVVQNMAYHGKWSMFCCGGTFRHLLGQTGGYGHIFLIFCLLVPLILEWGVLQSLTINCRFVYFCIAMLSVLLHLFGKSIIRHNV